MKLRPAVLPLVAVLLAMPALAEAPLRSLRPVTRPQAAPLKIVLPVPVAAGAAIPAPAGSKGVAPGPVASGARGPDASFIPASVPGVAKSLRPKPRPVTPASVLRPALPSLPAVQSPGQPVAPIPRSLPEFSAPVPGSVCADPSIRGTKIPPVIHVADGCGLADGVQITQVSGVKLSIPATVDCPTARALNSWVKRSVIPTLAGMGGGVARLEVAGSYTCRPRNNVRGAKVSEHGRGRAIDISGFTLKGGRSFSVEQGWNMRGLAEPLRRMHSDACGTFGTVLGPNSDPFHHDHLHLDTAAQRNGAYCR